MSETELPNDTPPLAPPPPAPTHGKRRYSEEDRAQIVAEVEAGATMAATARKHNVKAQTLGIWCRAKRAHNGNANGLNTAAPEPVVPAAIAPDTAAPATPVAATGGEISYRTETRHTSPRPAIDKPDRTPVMKETLFIEVELKGARVRIPASRDMVAAVIEGLLSHGMTKPSLTAP